MLTTSGLLKKRPKWPDFGNSRTIPERFLNFWALFLGTHHFLASIYKFIKVAKARGTPPPFCRLGFYKFINLDPPLFPPKPRGGAKTPPAPNPYHGKVPSATGYYQTTPLFWVTFWGRFYKSKARPGVPTYIYIYIYRGGTCRLGVTNL